MIRIKLTGAPQQFKQARRWPMMMPPGAFLVPAQQKSDANSGTFIRILVPRYRKNTHHLLILLFWTYFQEVKVKVEGQWQIQVVLVYFSRRRTSCLVFVIEGRDRWTMTTLIASAENQNPRGDVILQWERRFLYYPNKKCKGKKISRLINPTLFIHNPENGLIF